MDRNEPEHNPDLFSNRTKPSQDILARNRETMRQPVDPLSRGRALLVAGNRPFHAMVAA